MCLKRGEKKPNQTSSGQSQREGEKNHPVLNGCLLAQVLSTICFYGKVKNYAFQKLCAFSSGPPSAHCPPLLGLLSLMALQNNNPWAFAVIKHKDFVPNESNCKRKAKTNSKWDFSHSVNLLYLELANNKLSSMWKNMQPLGYCRMVGIGWGHRTLLVSKLQYTMVSSPNLFLLLWGCILQAGLTLRSTHPPQRGRKALERTCGGITTHWRTCSCKSSKSGLSTKHIGRGQLSTLKSASVQRLNLSGMVVYKNKLHWKFISRWNGF